MFTFWEIAFTLGEITFTFGEITFTFGNARKTWVWGLTFLLLGRLGGTLWVGGPHRGFREYLM